MRNYARITHNGLSTFPASTSQYIATKSDKPSEVARCIVHGRVLDTLLGDLLKAHHYPDQLSLIESPRFTRWPRSGQVGSRQHLKFSWVDYLSQPSSQ